MLIDGKSFFNTPIKNQEETYKQIIKMGRNNDYTIGNLLDYEYFSKHYKLIAIDFSKQIELKHPHLKQQIIFFEDNKLYFFEDLKEMEEQRCFSSLES